MSQPGFDIRAINRRIIAEFRANAGQMSGAARGIPLLLLTTTGAKTGLLRTSPLGYGRDGDSIYVIAMNAGAARNPDWYRNLLANPKVSVELGAETYQARARVVDSAEAEGLIARWAEQSPGHKQRIGQLTASSRRNVPVVVLDRL